MLAGIITGYRVTDPLGAASQVQCDAVGNRTAVIGPLSRRTTFTSNATNGLLAVSDPA